MKENKSLLNLNLLTCPRCRVEKSVESYLRLREIEEYRSQTLPIYKCSECSWIFSLSVAIPQELYTELALFFSQARNRLSQKELNSKEND
jgi:rubredoxin